jgi:hypothetical protein
MYLLTYLQHYLICKSDLFQLRKEKIELITNLPLCQFHPLKELADPFPEQGYGEKEEKMIILLKIQHFQMELRMTRFITYLIHIKC